MSYKRTMRGVDYLIENELDLARDEHGETFASLHEGAAVLYEELEEAKDEIIVERADFLAKEKHAQSDEKQPSRTSDTYGGQMPRGFENIDDDDFPF